MLIFVLCIAVFIIAFMIVFSIHKKKAFDPPYLPDPACIDLVAVMPFKYSHLVEIVNMIHFIQESRHSLDWPHNSLREDLKIRCLERLNILEISASKPDEE